VYGAKGHISYCGISSTALNPPCDKTWLNWSECAAQVQVRGRALVMMRRIVAVNTVSWICPSSVGRRRSHIGGRAAGVGVVCVWCAHSVASCI